MAQKRWAGMAGSQVKTRPWTSPIALEGVHGLPKRGESQNLANRVAGFLLTDPEDQQRVRGSVFRFCEARSTGPDDPGWTGFEGFIRAPEEIDRLADALSPRKGAGGAVALQELFDERDTDAKECGDSALGCLASLTRRDNFFLAQIS